MLSLINICAEDVRIRMNERKKTKNSKKKRMKWRMNDKCVAAAVATSAHHWQSNSSLRSIHKHKSTHTHQRIYLFERNKSASTFFANVINISCERRQRKRNEKQNDVKHIHKWMNGNIKLLLILFKFLISCRRIASIRSLFYCFCFCLWNSRSLPVRSFSIICIHYWFSSETNQLFILLSFR